jgi:hypothetical protein
MLPAVVAGELTLGAGWLTAVVAGAPPRSKAPASAPALIAMPRPPATIASCQLSRLPMLGSVFPPVKFISFSLLISRRECVDKEKSDFRAVAGHRTEGRLQRTKDRGYLRRFGG